MKSLSKLMVAACLIALFWAFPAGAGDDEGKIPSPDDFIKVEVMPQVVKQAKPVYPELAKKQGIEGKVVIRAYVNKEGKPVKAQVAKSSGVESLDKAALKAAKKNVYKPAILDGKPVGVWVSYTVVFDLDEDSKEVKKKSP